MVADGQFILTIGNHFSGLRKKDGCLEVNHGHRSHEWQSACRWQMGVPTGFSEDLGQWLIDPAACSGLFCIEERAHLDKPKPKHLRLVVYLTSKSETKHSSYPLCMCTMQKWSAGHGCSQGAGTDLAGGGLDSIPVHLIKDFVRTCLSRIT